MLYPPRDSAIRPLVARLLIAQGVPLFANRIETTSPSFGRAVTLADHGAGWFISRGVVAQDLADGRLVALPLDTRPTQGAVGVMTRAEEVAPPSVRAFVRVLSGLVETSER